MSIKRATIIILLFLCTLSVKAQTTVEEYNYITKGYRIQLESGLDIKSGYSFRDLGEWQSSTRACNFKALIRKKTGQLAATLAVFRDANGRTYFLCIPTEKSSTELFLDYKKSLGLLDGYNATIDYIYFLSEFYASRAK
jgi:hypothetical protein